MAQGKVVIVTGGAAGLGSAIAQRFVASGARVFITDVQADLGAEVARHMGADFIAHDVGDENEWRDVIETVEARAGRLDVLVNNAGLLSPRNVDVSDWHLSDWQRIFRVNAEGVFLGCRTAIPAMARSDGGAIVNISSIAGLMATPFAIAYGASKATVRHLTKSVAQHCAEQRLNIRCNSVHPGNVHTAGMDAVFRTRAAERGVSVDAILSQRAAVVPMGDLTRAEDIAGAVYFLASEDARHITGEQLIVDGGIVQCDSYHTDLTGRRIP